MPTISQPLGEQTLTPEKLDWIAPLLTEHPFRFAKTMPENPHWYTLRPDWDDEPGAYSAVIETILQEGYEERWGGRLYKMLNVNGFKYWSMIYQTHWTVEDSIVLNRKPIDEYDRLQSYGQIAHDYDGAFLDEDSLDENRRVMELIGSLGEKSVLDIGCGTGLLLDYSLTDTPNSYLGIDPSPAMLNRLIEKHPAYHSDVLCARMEEYAPMRERFDLITCLFGSAGHISGEWLNRIPGMLAPGGRYVVMFAEDTYVPVTWERMGVEIMPFTAGLHATGLPGRIIETVGHYHVFAGPD